MESNNKKKKEKKKSSGLKLFGKILLGIFIFLILLLLFIRSPWGQGIIVDRIVSYISNKTGTEVKIDRLFITFSGDINLEGLYLEDENGDTLVYSRELEAGIPLWPVIKRKGISVTNLEWQGVRAKVHRQDSVNGFNYQFLLDAFAPADTTATASTPQDTTGTSMSFSLGDITLNDFKLEFVDDVAGIKSKLDLGKLEVEMQEFALDSMNFEVGEAVLENTGFSYSQSKPFPESEEQTDPPLPTFSVESLEVINVSGKYESAPDGLLADLSISDFLLELPMADLAAKKIILERFRLRNSNFLIQTFSSTKEKDASEKTPQNTPFEWPLWNATAEEITLSNNNFQYLHNDATPKKGFFNPEAVDIRNLDLQANHLALKEGYAEAFVQEFSFRETSGLDLEKLNFDLTISEEEANLSNLNIQFNGNTLNGLMVVNYNSVASFLQAPEDAYAVIDLPQFAVDVSDVFMFQPELKKNEYLAALAKKRLSGRLSAKGQLSEIKIENTQVQWGTSTSLAAEGFLFNAADPERFGFDFPQFRAVSTRADLLNFIAEQDLGIQLPKQLSLTGQFKGKPEDISVDAQLISSAGNIHAVGSFRTAPGIAFETSLEAIELELGQLLQNPQIGQVILALEASGAGKNVNNLDALVQARISSVYYNGYEFTNLNIEGELEEGEGYANLDYKDANLNLELESFIEMDSVSPRISAQLDLIGADLQALGYSKRPINAALKLNGTFEGNATAYDVTTSITDGIAVYNNDSYLLGDLDILAHVREDTTSLTVNNRMLDLKLNSNASPVDFSNALNRHYESYLTDTGSADTIQNPVNLQLYAKVSPAPIMDEVLLPQLEELDTINVMVDFREKERNLAATVNLPRIKYYGSVVDSLQFNLDSDKEDLVFDFGLKNLDAGPLAIKETLLKGNLTDEELELDFTSNYNEKQLMHVKSLVSKTDDDRLRIHVDPEGLVLNFSEWNIEPENEILIGDQSWIFNDFELRRNDQLLSVSNRIPNVQKKHIGLHFENFTLAALLSYLNPEAVLASGLMNGNFVIEEPFGSTGMLADIQVNDFGVMNVPLGVLTLDGNAVGSRRYNLDLTLKEGDADLNLTGSYIANEESAEVDLQLLLNEIKMKVIGGLVPEAIHSTDGGFSGEITVNGTIAEPVYNGSLHFEQAAFTVATLNAPFVFPDENLRVDNEGLYMENFTILDKNDNSLVLDGSILTENLLNPEFDLSFTAENFTALNSTEEHNDLFYGIAVFDATGTLTGNLEVPQVEMDLDIKEETNMTYVIPKATLGIEEREGVVVFVNREDPDRILTQTQETQEKFSFSGILLNSYISLEENATFTVVLNQDTEDHIQASGEGDLLFDIYPNGRTTMSGRLEINDGYYEMSLYDLVTRRFDLMDGSSIVWAGDPLDADLNITAVYRLETSASSLMAPQITGADMDVQQRYRQELPFLVYLNIDGELTQPKLSFGLDMPEDEQGAIGGQVYGRVQQVNQQENELNKQVFSLLVLNRFFPDSGSDGSAGGTLAFARDNLNEALSDQLNIFSDRLLGQTGIDLKFGLDSYTDYQGESPQERTQLDISAQKSLMNDRLILSVGSEVDLQGSSQVEESSPVIGNVSIEYLLTENGRFRLKAFRRKSYENVIDGQLIISGLSLIFTQDFNKFHELWDQIVKEEKNTDQKKE